MAEKTINDGVVPRDNGKKNKKAKKKDSAGNKKKQKVSDAAHHFELQGHRPKKDEAVAPVGTVLVGRNIAVDAAQFKKFDEREKLKQSRLQRMKSMANNEKAQIDLGKEIYMRGVSYEAMKYVESLRHPRKVVDAERVPFSTFST